MIKLTEVIPETGISALYWIGSIDVARLMSLGIIIQARTGSTRLPNKMILPFYKGQNVLELLLKKIKSKYKSQQIILATSVSSKDDIIEQLGISAGVNVYRGSEQDVLSRFVDAAIKFQIDKILRICADNPFLDIDGVVTLTDSFQESDVDYLSFALSDGTPTIKTHYGFWSECVSLDALKRALQLTDEGVFHEHVTNYIYANKDIFRCDFIPIPDYLENNKRIRLTLDTIEDFEMQKELYSALAKPGEFPTARDVVDYLETHQVYYNVMDQQILKNSK